MSKKQPKLTELFPPSRKPARVGVYQHEFTDTKTIYFSLWNGKFWCINDWTAEQAKRHSTRSYSAYQPQFAGWRGLAVKP